MKATHTCGEYSYLSHLRDSNVLKSRQAYGITDRWSSHTSERVSGWVNGWQKSTLPLPPNKMLNWSMKRTDGWTNEALDFWRLRSARGAHSHMYRCMCICVHIRTRYRNTKRHGKKTSLHSTHWKFFIHNQFILYVPSSISICLVYPILSIHLFLFFCHFDWSFCMSMWTRLHVNGWIYNCKDTTITRHSTLKRSSKKAQLMIVKYLIFQGSGFILLFLEFYLWLSVCMGARVISRVFDICTMNCVSKIAEMVRFCGIKFYDGSMWKWRVHDMSSKVHKLIYVNVQHSVSKWMQEKQHITSINMCELFFFCRLKSGFYDAY